MKHKITWLSGLSLCITSLSCAGMHDSEWALFERLRRDPQLRERFMASLDRSEPDVMLSVSQEMTQEDIPQENEHMLKFFGGINPPHTTMTIFDYARMGDLKKVLKHTESGTNIEAPNNMGLTIRDCAAQGHDIACIVGDNERKKKCRTIIRWYDKMRLKNK